METDHSGVQLAQDFNVDRAGPTRSLEKLAKLGVLTPIKKNHRGALRYRINLDWTPPPPPAAVSPGAHVPGGAHVSGDTHPPVSADTHPPVSADTHSSQSDQIEKEKQGNAAVPPYGPGGPEGSYWEELLTPDDFLPGTVLVTAARSMGFARDEGAAKDGLASQRSAFFGYRKSRGYITPPKRAEFKSWLQEAAKRRASATPSPENNSVAVADRSSTPRPPRQVVLGHGTPPAWRAPWVAALDALPTEAQTLFERGELRAVDGAAVVVVSAWAEKHARATGRAALLETEWKKHLPAVAISIAATAPARRGSAAHR